MTTINIGGHRTTAYVVSGSDNTYVVKLNASINFAGGGAVTEFCSLFQQQYPC